MLALIGIALLTTMSPAQETTVKIEFTQVPAAGEGPDSQGDIAGRITGLAKPGNYKIVIYAHTDQWYVQPLADDPLTDIAADGKWSNWTHLGRRYAVLVVRPEFRPMAKTQMLPKVGDKVIAISEITAKGRK